MANERVVIEIELDDGSIKKGFATIKREGEKAGRGAGDNLEKGLKRGGERGFSFITKGFLGLAATLGGINLFRGAISSAIQTEKLNTQLKILTGSAVTASKVFSQLEEFSAATPFETNEIVNASNKLLAFGFEASEVRDRIREIGEVAAGSNANLNDVALIYGQVAAAGKLTGERLLQLQERSIPIGPALAKTLGVAESSLRDLVSAGKVTLPVFQQAFASLSEEGGKFAGALEAQSQTVGGILSTLTSNVSILETAFGDLFSPLILKASRALITGLQNLTVAIKQNSQEIQSSLIFTLNQLGAAFGTAKKGLKLFADEILAVTTIVIAFKTAAVLTAQLSTLGNAIGLARFAFSQLTTRTKLAIVEFNRLRASYGIVAASSLTFAGSLRALKTAFSIARLGAITFQASLTFGLSLIFTELLAFVIETKERLGGWGNFLQRIGLEAKLVFLQVSEAVINAVNTIVNRLSLLNNLPFGLGDKFSAFSDKLTETTIETGESIRNTQKAIEELSSSIKTQTAEVVEANNAIKQSNDGVTESVTNRQQAEKDLLSLRGQLGGVENELVVLEAQEAQRLQVLQTAKENQLLQEQEFQTLRQQVLQQSADQEQAIRDQALLNQEAGLNNFTQNFIGALRAQARASRVTFGEIARTAQGVLARGIGNSFQAIGKAIAGGQNAFDAFKDALKNVLGEIASATGDLFIKQGIGYLFFNPAVGAGLIAAGAGLKILSGVLGGGGGSTASVGGATGGGASLDLTADPTIAAADIEREEPRVVFQTTIQGDVLDGNETRERLINIFQAGAEEEGIEINQGVFA